MNSAFWTNTIWYLILGVLIIFEIVYIMGKVKRRGQTFAFYLTILGIALYFETIILVFLKAYTYYPKILHNLQNPFHDVIAGSLFSQFSVAATIVLVVVLNLNYYWYFLVAGIYGLIEELFLALGIYTHNWYQTWMTLVLVTLSFYISKIMYSKVRRELMPNSYYGYIYLGLFPLHNVFFTWVFMLTTYLDFSSTLLNDPISSQFFIAWVIFNLLAISSILVYFLKFKSTWKAMVIILNYMVYYIGYKLDLILIKEGWFLIVSTGAIFWMYISVVIMDRLYQQKSNS